MTVRLAFGPWSWPPDPLPLDRVLTEPGCVSTVDVRVVRAVLEVPSIVSVRGLLPPRRGLGRQTLV